VLREKLLVVELASEFVETARIDTGTQFPGVRLIVEGVSRGRREFPQATAKCFVYNDFEGLAGFAGELGEAISKIFFNGEGGSHIDIMMYSPGDVKMLFGIPEPL